MAWQLSAQFSPSVQFFAGAPLAIIQSLIEMILNESFHVHVLITGGEALGGLFIGTVVGTLSGLFMWYHRRVTELPILVISVVGSIPVLAFSPLMIVWFGIGLALKIGLAA